MAVEIHGKGRLWKGNLRFLCVVSKDLVSLCYIQFKSVIGVIVQLWRKLLMEQKVFLKAAKFATVKTKERL